MVTSVLALQDVKAGIGIGIASLVLFGAGVEEMRGKTGGTVFVTTKSGTYTKMRVKGANPKSPAQQENRQKHARLMRVWKSAQVDRKAYNEYASTHWVSNRQGKKIRISGINWFVKINRTAQKANPDCGLITSPWPISTMFPNFKILKVSASSTPESVIVEIKNVQDYAKDMRLEIRATLPLSPGVYNGSKKYRCIGVYNPLSSTSSDTKSKAIDITADYTAKFGPLTKGMKILMYVKLITPKGHVDVDTPGSVIIN